MNRPATRMAKASTTKATRSITATRRLRRLTSMPSRPRRSPPAPETKPESSEWMPLGVFAITQDNQAAGVEPTIFMQLAISKEGVISGTLNNTATNQTQTLEGMADKKSQRVAWSVAGQSAPSWRREFPTSRRIPPRRSSTLPMARRSSCSWSDFRSRSNRECVWPVLCEATPGSCKHSLRRLHHQRSTIGGRRIILKEIQAISYQERLLWEMLEIQRSGAPHEFPAFPRTSRHSRSQ